MMFNKLSIRDLIDSWPSIGQFSRDIGCGYEAARKMRARNSVAPEHWGNVLLAANKRGLSWVTIDWLISSRARGAVWPDDLARPDVVDEADEAGDVAGEKQEEQEKGNE